MGAPRGNRALPLTSEAYARELKEVQEIGSKSSAIRTPDQTDAALYWERAPFPEIYRSIAESRGLSAADAARMFAMATIARADAFAACFNDKYFWNTWRPETAIQEAALAGNPATHADSGWTSLFPAPPPPA